MIYDCILIFFSINNWHSNERVDFSLEFIGFV